MAGASPSSGDLARTGGGASALAGALAEAGVARLEMTAPGGTARTLRARETDLPGVLLAATPGTVLASSAHGLRIVVDATRFRWSTPDAALAGVLAPLRSADPGGRP